MATADRAVEPDDFRHEALFYAGDEDFVERALPFVREGVEREEPVLVVVSNPRLDKLRDALGTDAQAVVFGDMERIGANPARIIPAWRDFVAGRTGPARGIGEPIWAARPADELVECQRHEALLNVAFADAEAFALVCPYDTAALPQDVVDEALRTHPLIHEGGQSPTYRADPLLPEHPLPPVPPTAAELRYGDGPLDVVHRFVSAHAAAFGLPPSRVVDLAIAAHELAINSVRHAGGHGVVLIWCADGAVLCEVRDDGEIHDPLVGRAQPTTEQESGRGVWMVHQLCDLVQLRSSSAGTVVRVRMALDWADRARH